MKEQIEFSEFLEIEKKLDIRIGRIIAAERVEKSKKLIKLTVIFDIEGQEQKTVLTNLGSTFQPEDFIEITVPFVMNLKPVEMMGITSEAMIVVGNHNGTVELDSYSIGSKLF